MANPILIIIPTYNERENLEPLTEAVFANLLQADLLVVDDASPDGTGELALQLSADEPRVSVLRRSRKLGLGTAYIAGAGLLNYLVALDAYDIALGKKS